MRKILLTFASIWLAACGGAGTVENAAVVDSSTPLQIHWIDVEGGAATLIVTPAGETVLMDAGWAGNDDRDAKRIADVLENEAGRKEIDYFLTSHFHADHAGGIPGLAAIVPIKQFVDHGDSIESNLNERAAQLWQSYRETAGTRMTVNPGDTLPVSGVDFQFVTARGEAIQGDGSSTNPYCEGVEAKDVQRAGPENGQSVGFILRFGDFEFLDLGDFTWPEELAAVCPQNVFGQVDLFQVSHHGMYISNSPALIKAIAPQVAIMNNGAHKGGDPLTYAALLETPRLVDLWQVHTALNEGAANTDEDKIANLGETEGCEGHWIKATVQADGSFTILNSRNGFSKSYESL
jgi:beta-lactamase superfamily II metal-dependent hydrolase